MAGAAVVNGCGKSAYLPMYQAFIEDEFGFPKHLAGRGELSVERPRFPDGFLRTADRRLLEPVACAFAGMPRAAPGGRHSPSQPHHGRSVRVGRIERWTKRSLAWVPIVRLHPISRQPLSRRT